eukprot:8679043-Pyramimonas_sp.AAC.1
MDIYEGEVDGELKVEHNPSVSDFPTLSGTVRCRGVGLHFWDAPDDMRAVDMDLLFQGQRMYLHNAHGWYGGVPMGVSGDLDINPEGGMYRLSAQVNKATSP